MNHLNVVKTLDVVVEESKIYLVLEYVPGASLQEVVKDPDIPGRFMTPPIPAA